MDTRTGKIYEGTDEEIEAIEQELGRKLVRVPRGMLPAIEDMSLDQRRCYSMQLAKRQKRLAAFRRNTQTQDR